MKNCFFTCAVCLVACGTPPPVTTSDPTPPEPGASQQPAPEKQLSVALGIPGGADELEFVALEDDAELKLQTFGQGGTHILMAIQTMGFGNRAYTVLSLTNVDSGVTLTTPTPARPQLYGCDGDSGTCNLVPFLLLASGIAETDAEKSGLPVKVSAHVYNDAGDSADGSLLGHLSTANLGY